MDIKDKKLDKPDWYLKITTFALCVLKNQSVSQFQSFGIVFENQEIDFKSYLIN